MLTLILYLSLSVTESELVSKESLKTKLHDVSELCAGRSAIPFVEMMKMRQSLNPILEWDTLGNLRLQIIRDKLDATTADKRSALFQEIVLGWLRFDHHYARLGDFDETIRLLDLCHGIAEKGASDKARGEALMLCGFVSSRTFYRLLLNSQGYGEVARTINSIDLLIRAHKEDYGARPSCLTPCCSSGHSHYSATIGSSLGDNPSTSLNMAPLGAGTWPLRRGSSDSFI